MSPAPLPYWRLSSFYFWYYAALGAFTPYFAQWLHDLGQDATAISALMALWYATRVVAPPLWSSRTTASARPIRWLRAGALLTLLAFAGFLWVRDFSALFAVMLAFSFFCNAIMPQFEALTLDTLGPRRADYARLRVWGSIGFILVSLGYGWLLERHGSALLPALMLPLFAATTLSAFANGMPATHRFAPRDRPGAGETLRRPGVASFLAVAMLMQIGFGPYYVFFTLYLGQHGHGTDVIGVLWSLGVLAEIGMFMLAPRLLARFGPLRLMAWCLGLTALRWACTALWPQSWPLLVAMQLIHAMSFGIFHAACMHVASALFPGRFSAHGQALLYAISSGLGGVIGAGLAGLAWNGGGGLAAFLLAALACGAGLVVASRLRLPPEPEAR